jgi:hypothetical protein
LSQAARKIRRIIERKVGEETIGSRWGRYWGRKKKAKARKKAKAGKR